MRFFALLLACASCAFGAITFVGAPGPDLNNAVQAATRVLEWQNKGAESGCIALTGTTDIAGLCALGGPGFTGGNEGPQSQTRSAGELGISSGSDLRIVFDAVEPGGGAITLNALRVLVLNPASGALIFYAELDQPAILLASTLQGTGQSDALFKLDASSAAALDTAVMGSGIGMAGVRIGVYANASGSAGGPEAIYVGNRFRFDPDVTTTENPEPGTYMMVGCGLALLFLRRSS